MNVRTQIVSPVKDSLTDWRWWFSIAQIVFGCVLVAAGFALFIQTCPLPIFGVYGMGLVLHNLFPDIQVGTFGYMFDIPLLASAILIFGGKFGGRTLFAALITPGIMNIMSSLCYPSAEALASLDPALLLGGVIDLSDHLMLATIFGGVLTGVGVGIVVRNNATTGGTDIVAMLLNRFLKIKFSNGVLAADAFVVLCGLIVIGFGVGVSGDAEPEGWLLSLYSLIAIFVNSRVLAFTIDGASYDKLLFVISDFHSDEFREFIIGELNRSATYIKAHGMYSRDEKEMIFLVVSRNEVKAVQRKIKQIDPRAFLVVTDAYDTFGEGFKTFPKDDALQVE